MNRQAIKITGEIKSFISGISDLIYPPVCGLCGNLADSEDRLICRRCWDSIIGFDYPYCSACKRFLINRSRCADCGSDSLALFSLGYFDENLQKLIHDFKFYGLKPLGKQFGLKLGDSIKKNKTSRIIDCIIPVSLHPSRQYQRGFNQAEEIAQYISMSIDKPLYSDILYTTRKTRQQARLSEREREKNVSGAFAIDDDNGLLKGKTVLLIDDVTTTGATIRENRKILMEAEAKKVIAAVIASIV